MFHVKHLIEKFFLYYFTIFSFLYINYILDFEKYINNVSRETLSTIINMENKEKSCYNMLQSKVRLLYYK